MSVSQITKFRIDGMDCAGCAAKIDTAVRRMEGVEEVSVSAATGALTVRHGGGAALDADIQRKVVSLGYGARPAEGGASEPERKANPSHAHDHAATGHDLDRGEAGHGDFSHVHDHGPAEGPWWRSRKGRLTIAAGLAVALAWGVGQAAPAVAPWAFSFAMLVGLIPIGRRAAMAALNGAPFTIESLMSIAVIGAVIIGAAEEAAIVVFLFLVGELLEGVASGRARAGIRSLTALIPAIALVEVNGRTREVPAENLSVGAVILVRPGDRVPADGDIVSGDGAVDESAITGESAPVRKGPGGKIFAGSINGEAALRVRVTATASDNTIARIIKLVEEAQESKAPTERFIDRFSRWYTPAVLVVGALVAIAPPLVMGGAWAEWIYKGLAVLLIGCPCALVISTPAAIAAALSSGARRGLLMKGGALLETLGKITVAAFDKTGTLTAGKPVVTDILSFGSPEADILSVAAALEAGSSHPLALAILRRADDDGISPPSAIDAKALGGKGVAGVVDGVAVFLGSPRAAEERAALTAEQKQRIAALNDQGKTVSVLLIGEDIAGAIAMRDEPRPDAKAGLKALTDAGIKTVMLTGDNIRVASAIAGELGIEARAELLPEDKQRIVGELKAQGMTVAKIGDGVNDAPALAAADVGIAMGGGTDVALETADAAILHGRVGDVAAMVLLSRRAMRNIYQNIAVALGLKAAFLVTTIIGVTGLWPAILADTGATVLVTMNALRLLAAPAKT